MYPEFRGLVWRRIDVECHVSLRISILCLWYMHVIGMEISYSRTIRGGSWQISYSSIKCQESVDRKYMQPYSDSNSMA
jgi:hypothetical protein